MWGQEKCTTEMITCCGKADAAIGWAFRMSRRVEVAATSGQSSSGGMLHLLTGRSASFRALQVSSALLSAIEEARDFV